jgi:hypothetical protein
VRRDDLHLDFEKALASHKGKVLSRRELANILQRMFPGFPDGSCVPTDHAEPSAKHVNQCRKCATPDHQILDTVVDGRGVPFKARYRVRDFRPFPR